MSEREVRRVEVLNEVHSSRRTVAAAASVLCISERQAYRLLARYQENAGFGLVHKARGRTSNRSHNPGVRKYAFDLVKTHYADFGPTLATEALAERHAIHVGRETLRRWMHSVFRVVRQDTKGGQGMTQFGRALSELNIEILCANSRQAKGRVERVNRTLQDRLVKELRLAGISDMVAGNAFLPAFMERYNERFAVPAARTQDLHRPLRTITPRLNDILCHREQRYVGAQLTFHLRPQADHPGADRCCE